MTLIVEQQLLVVDDQGERQVSRGELSPRILHDGAGDPNPPLGDHRARDGARPSRIAREQDIQTHAERVAQQRKEQNRRRRTPLLR